MVYTFNGIDYDLVTRVVVDGGVIAADVVIRLPTPATTFGPRAGRSDGAA